MNIASETMRDGEMERRKEGVMEMERHIHV